MRNFLSVLILTLLIACNNDSSPGAGKKVSVQPKIAGSTKLDSLRSLAHAGDLVLRLGDDMISYSIRYLSERDPSFSHVGLLVPGNSSLLVAHIAPDRTGRDTIQYEALDSFLNPAKNLTAGLYRFRISDAERTVFLQQIRYHAARKVHFDYEYNLATEDRFYCTELIAKSLAVATKGRVHFAGKELPRSMLKLMYAYFSNLSADTTLIRHRPFISLDQLTNVAQCDSIYKTTLR